MGKKTDYLRINKSEGAIHRQNTRKNDGSPGIHPRMETQNQLQRSIGNRAVERLFKSGVIQAKGGTAAVPQVSPATEARINSLRGGGRPLDAKTRAYFEPRFGADFSHVRVHFDNQAARSAESLNSRAFTVKRDVFFGNGEYQPETTDGKRIMAHELVHTIQQDKGEKMIHRWLTKLNTKRRYAIIFKSGESGYREIPDHCNHENITEKVIEDMNKTGRFVISEHEKGILVKSSAEPDEWKASMERIAKDTGTAEDRKKIPPELKKDVGLYHSYYTKEKTWTEANRLRELAANKARKGDKGNAYRLLGISLHTIQDYYAHAYKKNLLKDADFSLNIKEDADAGWMHKDDPGIYNERWQEAFQATWKQLQMFYSKIKTRR